MYPVINAHVSAQPYAFAALGTVVTGYISDKHNRRGIYLQFVAIIGIIGYVRPFSLFCVIVI